MLLTNDFIFVGDRDILGNNLQTKDPPLYELIQPLLFKWSFGECSEV
jgi:hypothetical protein